MRSHITAHAQNPPPIPSGHATLRSVDTRDITEITQMLTDQFNAHAIPTGSIVWTAEPDLEWLLKKHPVLGVI